MKDILNSTSTDARKEIQIENIMRRYEELTIKKADYTANLQFEIKEREIEKQSNFKENLLNIKLTKFNGFNSSCDIYTFQRDSEKVHWRLTPKNYLIQLYLSLKVFKTLMKFGPD